MACETLRGCIDFDCDNISVAGVEETFLIFNIDDVTSFTTDVTNPQWITALTLSAPSPGFRFSGTRKSAKGMTEDSDSDYGLRRATHTIEARVLSIDNLTYQRMAEVRQGNYVVALFTANKTIEVYGLQTGLIGLVSKDTSEADGTFMVTFQTQEGYTEGLIPYLFYGAGGNYATNKALLLGYTTCP